MSASCLSTLHHTRPEESPEEPNEYVLLPRGLMLHDAPSPETAALAIPSYPDPEPYCQVWPVPFRLVQHRDGWTEVESVPWQDSHLHPQEILLEASLEPVRFWVQRDALIPVSRYTRSVSNNDGSGFVIRAGVAFPKNCDTTKEQARLSEFGVELDQPKGWVGESYSPEPREAQPEQKRTSTAINRHPTRFPRLGSSEGDVLDQRGDLKLFRVKEDWGEVRVWIPTSRLDHQEQTQNPFHKRTVIDFSDIDLSDMQLTE